MYNYDYNFGGIPSTSAEPGFWAAIAAIIGVVVLICLAVAVLIIIAQWRMFKKGNQPGWAAIIPIYNTYIQCKLVGVNPWWILIVILSGFLGFIPVVGNLLTCAVSIYFTILLGVSTARAFGKEDVFAVGLILLPVVFYPILGFGKVEYKGNDNPMNDFVFKKAQEVYENKATPAEKYCASCGAGMAKSAKFCPKCGKDTTAKPEEPKKETKTTTKKD